MWPVALVAMAGHDHLDDVRDHSSDVPDPVLADLRLAYGRRAVSRATMPDDPWKQSERTHFLRQLDVINARTLLEIGAGHGVSGRYFAAAGLDVVCTDLSPELVEVCRDAGLRAEVMDFGRLTFKPGSFDAVFGMNCLLHVPSARLGRVLGSVRSVLRPEGLFYWGQYTTGVSTEGEYADDDYEPRRFFSFLSDDDIRAAVGDGFELAEFRRVTPPGDRLYYQALVLRAVG